MMRRRRRRIGFIAALLALAWLLPGDGIASAQGRNRDLPRTSG